eukprot:TRINITY_DN3772_c0_g1_i2.p1 TRINITY_DN3772_c0_g1~~TRINITY_DN3772_c0_g1_i2.p1  ORF type:complete len:416 (+),score=126.92 TRINITY_DN3772_c0_g1_i2:38-1285(+)
MKKGSTRLLASSKLYTSFSRGLHNNPVIVSAVRTPVGSFGGSLSSLSASKLGAIAVSNAVKAAGIQPNDVQEVYMGNVISAGMGQAPARQATIFAGLPESVITTTVNKVCASGMKSIMLSAQSIMTGQSEILVAGGMESMSNVPYYLPKARNGYKYGHGQVLDGLLHDGLWDVYNDHHMGMCGEACATKYNISREMQDNYAVESYKRAAAAVKAGAFAQEIVPVSIPQKKGPALEISEDEEYKKIDFDKVPKLSSAFKKDGTVTAANASSLNDGASALIIMSEAKAKEKGLTPLARIIGFGDAEMAPIDFPIAPSMAIPKALKHAGITDINSVDFWEINEAFSVVSLANMQLLGIKHEKLNVLGGAVGLGHPIGSSGARIVVTLAHLLKNKNAKIGVAAICNGGGGASAIVLEKY